MRIFKDGSRSKKKVTKKNSFYKSWSQVGQPSGGDDARGVSRDWD